MDRASAATFDIALPHAVAADDRFGHDQPCQRLDRALETRAVGSRDDRVSGGCDQRPHLPVVARRHAGAARRAERGERSVVAGQIARAGEELRVLRARGRPARLDEGDAPRGEAVEAKGGQNSFYAIDYAARMAMEMGADIVKLNMPKIDSSKDKDAPAPYNEMEVDQTEAIRQCVESAGRALVVLSGGSKTESRWLIQQVCSSGRPVSTTEEPWRVSVTSSPGLYILRSSIGISKP